MKTIKRPTKRLAKRLAKQSKPKNTPVRRLSGLDPAADNCDRIDELYRYP